MLGPWECFAKQIKAAFGPLGFHTMSLLLFKGVQRLSPTQMRLLSNVVAMQMGHALSSFSLFRDLDSKTNKSLTNPDCFGASKMCYPLGAVVCHAVLGQDISTIENFLPPCLI